VLSQKNVLQSERFLDNHYKSKLGNKKKKIRKNFTWTVIWVGAAMANLAVNKNNSIRYKELFGFIIEFTSNLN
jgi:hypothetical protein